MRVLVTGGLGYVGSHVVHALLANGHDVVTLDRVVPGLRRPLFPRERFVLADVLLLGQSMSEAGSIGEIDAVVHLAAMIEAPQSVRLPEVYYRVNFSGTLNVLELAGTLGASRFVFASSAAVYGRWATLPIEESQEGLTPENPYGGSKLFGERLVADVCARRGIGCASLRFFNIVGSDPEVRAVPTGKGLFGAIVDAILGERPHLNVYGTCFDTPDGSAIRDYVHVSDVANAVLAALLNLQSSEKGLSYNVGSGTGFSVKEVVAAARNEFQSKLPLMLCAARPGEVEASVACIARARDKLGWQPKPVSLVQALREELEVRRAALV